VKAIVQDKYGSPDVLELRDIDKPIVGDRDLLVRVHAAAVDPGVWHLMTGLPHLRRLLCRVRLCSRGQVCAEARKPHL
jgi:NADPH:quinone reductase-like Zn-dependent oxidoreductase